MVEEEEEDEDDKSMGLKVEAYSSKRRAGAAAFIMMVKAGKINGEARGGENTNRVLMHLFMSVVVCFCVFEQKPSKRGKLLYWLWLSPSSGKSGSKFEIVALTKQIGKDKRPRLPSDVDVFSTFLNYEGAEKEILISLSVSFQLMCSRSIIPKSLHLNMFYIP